MIVQNDQTIVEAGLIMNHHGLIFLLMDHESRRLAFTHVSFYL